MEIGKILKVIDAKNFLIQNGIDIQKSNNDNFSWYIEDIDTFEEDYLQENGVHLSDKDLIDYANEIKNI